MDLNGIIPFLLIIAIFYWLVIRPNMQEQAAHRALLASLARDDAVVTSSGIHGKVVQVYEDTVVLEIADRTKITLDKASVARRQTDPASGNK